MVLDSWREGGATKERQGGSVGGSLHSARVCAGVSVCAVLHCFSVFLT